MPSGSSVTEETPHWPMFVISLPDAASRRARFLVQCAGLGLIPTVIDATDGRNGLPEAMENRVDRAGAQARVGRFLSDAELACSLSHQGIYRRIIDEGLPGAIILEDDAILTPLFTAFMKGRGYLAADFVQMDHMDTRVWYSRRTKWSADISLIPLAENASLATGYSLSAKGARAVLDRSTPVAGLADWPCDMTEIGAVATWPRIVEHPPFTTADSAIEGGRRVLVEAVQPPKNRGIRFMRSAYWQRWWLKRRTRKIS